MEAGAPGERGGQMRISSAHCCLAGSGAARSPASQRVPERQLPASQLSTRFLRFWVPKERAPLTQYLGSSDFSLKGETSVV